MPCVPARVFPHRHENFEAYLRRQFTRRVPYKPNPLGHEDEPTHWSDVDFLLKLDMLFHLCEWQFTGAGRLRTMMGEVDDLEWVCLTPLLSSNLCLTLRSFLSTHLFPSVIPPFCLLTRFCTNLYVWYV